MWKGRTTAEKIRETVKRWRLFDHRDRVLVAVSGGVDSVTLLDLTRRLPLALRPEIEVAHFNHRLRGTQSEEEAHFVENLSRDWGFPCHLAAAPEWRSRSNLEARARRLRYDFLKETAGRLGLKKVLTAHQADDQVETFVLRWLQGAGLKGLAGIPLRRLEGPIVLIRPLLMIPRREIEDYAKQRRLAFRTDPTNRSDDFLRSRIRKWLWLQRENSRLSERTAVNSILLRADQTLLDAAVESLFQTKILGGEEKVSCSLREYQRLPDALRYRFLQRMVRELISSEYALPSRAVLKIDELLTDSSPRHHYDLPHGLGIEKDYVSFQVYRKRGRRLSQRAKAG